jgi:hypothetical protein
MTADMKWKLVPAEPTQEMLDTGSEANPTEWNEGTDPLFREEVADAIYRAMLAASPPAPVAEPVAGLQYRPHEFDDWGMIRAADGRLFATVRRPLGEEEATQHRVARTDPFEPLARALMTGLALSPIDPAAIRAEARREALEEAAALMEAGKEVTDPLDYHRSTIMVDFESGEEAADAIRALIDKEPG